MHIKPLRELSIERERFADMKKASEYYQHALECRQLAARTADADHKATLLRMAETWETLAYNRADHAARRQRIEALTHAVTKSAIPRKSWVSR